MVWGWGEIHYDLPSGGYTTSVGFYNEFENPPDFVSKPDEGLYTPQGLRKYGLR